APLIERREAVGSVVGKARRAAERRIRRIAVHEVALARVGQRAIERLQVDGYPGAGKCGSDSAQMRFVADAWIGIAPGGYVESPASVQAKQPVEAGAVQKAQHRGE